MKDFRRVVGLGRPSPQSFSRSGTLVRKATRAEPAEPNWKAYAWQPGAGQATTFGLWCGKIGPRFSAKTQGGLCWTEGSIMRSACLYGSSLGLCWAQVVPMLGQVGPMLSHLGILGLCWPSRAHVEPSGPSWAYIGPVWAYVGLILGPCWAYVGPMLAYVGPMWPHVEPSWGPCLGHLCWNDLKMPICPSRAPPRAQNQVKTDVFEHRQDKIRGHWRARNTVKNDVFLTPQAKNTVNYRSFSRGESTRGEPGVGRQGRRASITFGYS